MWLAIFFLYAALSVTSPAFHVSSARHSVFPSRFWLSYLSCVVSAFSTLFAIHVLIFYFHHMPIPFQSFIGYSLDTFVTVVVPLIHICIFVSDLIFLRYSTHPLQHSQLMRFYPSLYCPLLVSQVSAYTTYCLPDSVL